MTDTVGAYAVIRYVPDLVRDEPINIGVVLHAPGQTRPLFLVPNHVRDLGRPGQVEQDLLEWVRAALVDVRDHVFGAPPGDLDAMVRRFSESVQPALGNHFRLTPPRDWGITADPVEELKELYQLYVAPHLPEPAHDRYRVSSKEVRKYLKRTFQKAGAETRIRPITRPGLKTGVPVTAPWAWLNGRLNFCEAVSLAVADFTNKEQQIRALVQKAEDLAEDPQRDFTVFVHLPRRDGDPRTEPLLKILNSGSRVLNAADGNQVDVYVRRVMDEGRPVGEWPEGLLSD